MRIKVIFLLIGLTTLNSLQGLEELMTIDALEANFDGKKIILSGDVMIQQKLGQIAAENMVLTPLAEEGNFLLSNLEMEGKVQIKLNEGGQLDCSRANLKYLNSEGFFYSDSNQEFVVYQEECQNKKDRDFKILLKSREIKIYLNQENEEKKDLEKAQVERVVLSRDVHLNYDLDFIATSDHAEYFKNHHLINENPKKMIGHIVLHMDHPSRFCQIMNKNGDLIRSTQIDIDTLDEKIDFTYPNGYLSFRNSSNEREKMTFESDEMFWNHKEQSLQLVGNIKVTDKGYGELFGDKQIDLFYTVEDGKKKLSKIESVGETILAYIDEEKKLVHTLTSYGKVTVDHEHLKTTIESPVDEANKVKEGMQIYFNDLLGEIYADHAVVDYQEIEGKVKIDRLTLEGNVRILNRSSVNPEESEAFLQYALADVVEFYPNTNEMMMKASDNKRVLFYDKVNQLEISAPGVKIKRDMITKKESIQGIGDARFSLVDEELEKLKTHFSLEPFRGM